MPCQLPEPPLSVRIIYNTAVGHWNSRRWEQPVKKYGGLKHPRVSKQEQEAKSGQRTEYKSGQEGKSQD